LSTKIYNGLIFKENYGLLTLKEIMSGLRKEIDKVVQEEVLTSIGQMATSIIDDIYQGKKHYAENKYNRSVLSKVINNFEDRQTKIKNTSIRDPLVDFSCDVVILPIRNKIIAMYYCENPEIYKIIKKQKYWNFYGYWDNTDPYSECTEEEWNQREKDWDEALPNFCSIPAKNGFVCNISPIVLFIRNYVNADKVLKYIPKYEKRIKENAENNLINERLKKITPNTDFIYSTLMQIKKDIKGETNKEIERLRKILPEKITKEMLLQELDIQPKPINI